MVAYSPDGALFAVASSVGVWLYDAHTGAEVTSLGGDTLGVRRPATRSPWPNCGCSPVLVAQMSVFIFFNYLPSRKLIYCVDPYANTERCKSNLVNLNNVLHNRPKSGLHHNLRYFRILSHESR